MKALKLQLMIVAWVSMRAQNVSQIIMNNSSIIGRNEESSSSCLVIHNSNITISDSIFANNSMKLNSTQPTLLNASTNSSIELVNCIVSGNTGHVSIIQVTNQSSLRLINSDISYNKIFNESLDPKYTKERSIVRINDSSVLVVSSNFTHNELVSPTNGGSVMFISCFSKIHVEYLEGCFFARNQGTSLYTLAFPGGRLNITNSHIAENYSPKGMTGTFSFRGVSLGSGDYYLSNCTFVKNYADDGGGVFSEAGSTLYFKNCIFKENRAFTAGAVDVTGMQVTHFENCSFIANEGILHTGAAMGQSGAHLVIHNCLFEHNHGINAIGAVGIKIRSKLTVLNSTFVNNTSDLRAGALLLEKDVIAYISDSTFINNSAVHHGCINTNSNVTLQVSRTRFTGNNAKYAAVLFSEYDVKVQLLS